MNRVINFYPLENPPSLLPGMAAGLQAVISQRLVRTKSGARVAAVEVLLNTRHIAELIEKGEINEIKDALEKSMSPGSQTFEQALFKLFMDGKISQEEAMANADSATNMLWLINQATAGDITGQAPAAPPPGPPRDRPALLHCGNPSRRYRTLPYPPSARGAGLVHRLRVPCGTARACFSSRQGRRGGSFSGRPRRGPSKCRKLQARHARTPC